MLLCRKYPENMGSVYGVYITGLKSLALVIKKAFTYLEACSKKQEKYFEEIKDTPPQDMVYVDETGIEIACHKR